MALQQIINNIFRQNFSDPAVLARVLFGLSVFLIGMLNLLYPAQYAGLAPAYLPLPFFLALGVGAVLTISGFLIFANLFVERATYAIIFIYIAFILIVYLPIQSMVSVFQSIVFIAGALLIGTLARRERG